MNFAPVHTFDDLDGLDHDQVVEGYAAAESGDPEPGQNRGRSYWHGWRSRMMDLGEIPIDDGHRNLVREYLEHQQKAREFEAAQR